MHTRTQEKIHHTTKGSFLMELLLAFAIISISMVVVVDSFLSSQRSYRTIAEEGALTKAVTVVLENMTREARVSNKYRCTSTGPAPCNTPGDSFYMTHIEGLNDQGAGEHIDYTLNGSVIEKNTVPMTPPTVKITEFTVEVFGTAPQEQVRARITLTAESASRPGVEVHLQTSFTERDY